MSLFIKRTNQIEEGLAGMILLAVCLFTFVETLLRYSVSYTFPWFQEVANYTMVLFTYLGAAIGVKYGTHFSMEALGILRQGLWGLFLPFLVLGGIYGGVFTPTEAAAVSVVYALAVELLVYRELTLPKLYEVCRNSAVLSGCLLFFLSCAMTFVWLLTVEQIPVKLADLLVSSIDSRWLFLLAINGALLFIGALMDIVTAIIVISPVLVETLARYQIEPIHYGIIMIVNIECGFLTPPFGLNLFVSMAIVTRSLVDIGKAVLPFILLFLCCLLVLTYVPKLSLLLPDLLMTR